MKMNVPVPPPVRQASPYGLRSVLPAREDDGSRWDNHGVTWPRQVGGLGTVGKLDCDNPNQADGLPVDPPACAGWVDADNNVTVWASSTATALAASDDELLELARQALLLSEDRLLEKVTWDQMTGNTAQVAASAVPMAEAIGMAEQWAAHNFGGVGVIHMPSWAVYGHSDVFTFSRGSLTTLLGTPVVAGTGYPVAAGTGAVEIRVSGPGVAYSSDERSMASMDHTTNDRVAVVERSHLIGWDAALDNGPQFGSVTASVNGSASAQPITSTTTTTTTVA